MEKEKDINHTEKTQEEMVKEAVEEAKKAASEAEAEKPEAEAEEQESSEEAVEQAEADKEEASEGKKGKLFGKKKKEKSQMYEIGAKDIIEKILPVVDNFERGLAAVAEDDKEDPFVQGMDKIYKQLMTTLDGIGVKPIEAVGQEFNPDFHNAVMHEENEEAGENTITEEFQKGYMYRDSVVRHSMVKVAN